MENILIGDSYTDVQLTDFGLATVHDKSTPITKLCGTALYLAPEQIKKRPYDFKVDMWCLGIVGYELLSLKLPW